MSQIDPSSRIPPSRLDEAMFESERRAACGDAIRSAITRRWVSMALKTDDWQITRHQGSGDWEITFVDEQGTAVGVNLSAFIRGDAMPNETQALWSQIDGQSITELISFVWRCREHGEMALKGA